MVIGLMNVVDKQRWHHCRASRRTSTAARRDQSAQGRTRQAEDQSEQTAADLSSEKERRQSKPHRRGANRPRYRSIGKRCSRSNKSNCPADAVFKGYEDVVVQDLEIRTDNVQFRKEKYYSPGQKRTYLAPLASRIPRPVWAKSESMGVGDVLCGADERAQTPGGVADSRSLISAGQLSDMLIKDQEVFHAERASILQAGLESSPWQHLDSTGTRVNGHNQHCHVLCNPLYTALLHVALERSHEHASRPSWGSRSRLPVQ